MRQALECLSACRGNTRFRRCAIGYRRNYRAARRIVRQPAPHHPQYRSRLPSLPARLRSGSWSQTRTNNCLRLPLTTRPTAGSNELSSPLIRPGIADRLFHAPVLTSVTSRCVMYRRRNTSNSNHSPSVPANECGLKTQSADTFRSMRLTRTRSLDPGLRKVFREARVPSERLKSRKPTMPFLVQITV